MEANNQFTILKRHPMTQKEALRIVWMSALTADVDKDVVIQDEALTIVYAMIEAWPQ